LTVQNWFRAVFTSNSFWIFVFTWGSIVVTISLVGFFGYYRMEGTLLDDGRRSLASTARQTSSFLDQQFRSFQSDILKIIDSNPAIQAEVYFKTQSSTRAGMTPLQALSASDEALTQMQKSHENLVDSILLLLNNGMNFLDADHHLAQYAPIDEPYEWFRDKTLFSTSPVWITQQPPILYNDHIHRIFVSQWLEGSPTDAILVVAMRPQYIHDVLSNVELARGGGLSIRDKNGHWLYGMTPPEGLREALTPALRVSRSAIVEANHESYWYEASVIPANGWTVVAWEPQSVFLTGLNDVRTWMWNAIIVGGVIALAVTSLFAWGITLPLRQLRGVMKQAEQGVLSVQFKSRFGWEIRELAAGFNAMMARLQDLLNTLQQKEKAKRELELQVLQAQMNPHFLYNTLDTMYWMSYQNGDYQVSELALALGKFFRLSLNEGKSTIPFHEELEHLKSYITI